MLTPQDRTYLSCRDRGYATFRLRRLIRNCFKTNVAGLLSLGPISAISGVVWVGGTDWCRFVSQLSDNARFLRGGQLRFEVTALCVSSKEVVRFRKS